MKSAAGGRWILNATATGSGYRIYDLDLWTMPVGKYSAVLVVEVNQQIPCGELDIIPPPSASPSPEMTPEATATVTAEATATPEATMTAGLTCTGIAPVLIKKTGAITQTVELTIAGTGLQSALLNLQLRRNGAVHNIYPNETPPTATKATFNTTVYNKTAGEYTAHVTVDGTTWINCGTITIEDPPLVHRKLP